MNRIIFILAAFMAISTISCKKIDKLTQFDKDYSYETSIGSVIGINLPFDLPTPDIKTNISEDLALNNSKVDLIEQALVKALKVTITNPEDGDFDFLNQIEIFINADGLSKEKVAYKYDIPNTIGKTLEMDLVPDFDLQAYLKKDEFTLDITITTDKLLFHQTDIKVDATFAIDAKILGI